MSTSLRPENWTRKLEKLVIALHFFHDWVLQVVATPKAWTLLIAWSEATCLETDCNHSETTWQKFANDPKRKFRNTDFQHAINLSQSAPNEHESLCNMRLNLTSTPPCKSKAAEHQDHFAVKWVMSLFLLVCLWSLSWCITQVLLSFRSWTDGRTFSFTIIW